MATFRNLTIGLAHPVGRRNQATEPITPGHTPTAHPTSSRPTSENALALPAASHSSTKITAYS